MNSKQVNCGNIEIANNNKICREFHERDLNPANFNPDESAPDNS